MRQTDAEHEMLGWLHAAADEGAAVVLNPAAWSHYNYAVRDACAMLRGPLVEVHISNIHAREEFRHHSVVSAVATGVIAGWASTATGWRWSTSPAEPIRRMSRSASVDSAGLRPTDQDQGRTWPPRTT